MSNNGEAPILVELRAGHGLVPLQGMNVLLTVEQYVAQVEVVTRFVNNENNPIEAVFSFQQEDTCIYQFKVETAGRVLVSVCKEKEEAANKYDDAIAGGHGAYMLTKEDNDMYKLNVGNISSKAECVVSIKYATLLSTVGDALRLSVPITKVPISSEPVSSTSPVSVRANINMTASIVGIESESQIEYEVNGTSATLSTKGHVPGNEFVLSIGINEPHQEPSAIVEVHEPASNSTTGANGTTVMVSFYPSNDCIFQDSDDEVLMEYVFLVDRSGSMNGTKIQQASNALQLFLRSIPEGSLFNIVGFGSRYALLFPRSVAYNDNTLATATDHAAKLKADLGGTNILAPLKTIMKQPPNSQFPRQVIILTDGQVDDQEGAISFVKKNSEKTRVFTLGIGSHASKRLVLGLAKAGKGQAELVFDEERMETKVLAQLKRAMQPYLYVTMDWGTLADSIKQSPTAIPPVFPGDPVVVFGLLSRELTPSDDQVTMKLSNAKGVNVQKRVTISSARISRGCMFGVLAASASIREIDKQLEDDTVDDVVIKSLVVPLALKYSLVTRCTSLLAQDLRSDPVESSLQLREFGTTDTRSREFETTSPAGDRAERSAKVLTRSARADVLSSLASKREALIQGSSGVSPGFIEESIFSRISSLSAYMLNLSAKPGYESIVEEEGREKKSTRITFIISSAARSQACSLNQSADAPSESSSPSQTSSCTPLHQPSSSLDSNPRSSSSSASSSPLFFTPATAQTSNGSTNDVDTDKRPVDELIILQKASGNWDLTDALLALARVSHQELKTCFGETVESKWLENVIATALALAVLEWKFAGSVEEWGLLRDKAMRWMKKELQKNSSSEAAAVYVGKARDLLSTL